MGLVTLLLAGCASTHSLGSAGGFPERADGFQRVQEASGLGEEARHPPGAVLDVERARHLLTRLATAPVSRGDFGPRRVLSWMLREVAEGGERVEYAELQWRLERFAGLVVVRPDGYLVTALSGAPLQRLGPLQFTEGSWRVGRLGVGDFYFSRGGVFYPVNAALRRVAGPPLGELGLERDALNAALDGAQEAFVEMAVALAESIRHPIRTLEGLVQLPTQVALLIASSPEYFAHYGVLSREEQIREAARLSTHVLLLLGSAEATAGRLSGLGAEVSAFSLTARGELSLTRALVTEGAGVSPGGVSVVHLAVRRPRAVRGGATPPGQSSQTTAAARGPGRWTYKKPTTESTQALDYQEQVTGRPAWWVYTVGEVEFDGFNGQALLEAKGASYSHFLTKNGTAQPWFASGRGYQELLAQARRQSEMARVLNLPVVWHVAEADFANFLRKVFKTNGWDNITVHHTPSAG